MKITLHGAGYVGLVTSVCFAEMGNQVLCVDIDEYKISQLKKGISPIYEPGLEALLQKNLAAGTLVFTTDPVIAVRHGFIQFIAVGTPPDEDGSADLQYVLKVAETIAYSLDGYCLIVNKSTVPVGTADKIRSLIQSVLNERSFPIPFDVLSNPEFLKGGSAIQDFMRPDRIIVGGENPKAIAELRQLYLPFNRNHERFIVMDTRSAELTKYAANAMLATRISFMNEMSHLAERLGADIESVRLGIGSDERIGYHFTYPGCGYGGSCFPKDIYALQHMAERLAFKTPLLSAVSDINERQKKRLLEKINYHFQGNLRNKVLALWGLAFKPNTDDMREAPSRTLIDGLLAQGARIQAYDPVAMNQAKRLYPQCDQLMFCEDAEQALEGADALILVTEWNIFKSPDFTLIKQQLKNPVIFDGRNLYEPKVLKELGFLYYAIGRGERARGSSL
jgi:UDPglucose 6-dehydrogenase